MGRPVNKRFFGSGAGSQIKVRFKTGGTEYDGYIVSQRGTRKFRVSDGTRTIIATLVNKSTGGLDNGDVIVNVLTDGGIYEQATKLFNRVAIIEGTRKQQWNFAASESDGAVQVTDVEGPTIVILTQPVSLTVEDEAPAVFSINITGVAEASATYQWQYNDGNAWTNFNQQGGIYLGWDTATLTITATPIAITGYQFRCVVTSSGAANSPLTSAAATLTVTA
jgi:hypothetical protein